MVLTAPEVRVLGCLVEKQLVTPDLYPLTLNALVHACNQTSNRNPVVSYDEGTVLDALQGLRDKQLARIVYSRSNRAAKYRQVLEEELGLTRKELAVLALLLLRGPQTPGELRARGDRLAEFTGLGDVEESLEGLARRPDEPLVVQLGRLPGQKEARYAHLMGAEPAASAATTVAAAPAPVAAPATSAGDRIASLEAEVAALRAELAGLRAEIADLRRQWE